MTGNAWGILAMMPLVALWFVVWLHLIAKEA